MLERADRETKAAVDTILDCFAASDGGINFVKFCSLIEGLDVAAQRGDDAAEQIISKVKAFANLVKFANQLG